MYASSYNRIFWGMMFIIFNFNLGSINLLPNFIGYILIYSALEVLSSQQEIYNRGKIPCIILTLLTIKDIWNNPNNNILSGQFINLGLANILISSISTVVHLYLIYIICTGIYKISEVRELIELKDNISTSWKFYLVSSSIILFLTPFSINFPSDITLIYILASIFQIITSISISVVFRKCRITLEN